MSHNGQPATGTSICPSGHPNEASSGICSICGAPLLPPRAVGVSEQTHSGPLPAQPSPQPVGVAAAPAPAPLWGEAPSAHAPQPAPAQLWGQAPPAYTPQAAPAQMWGQVPPPQILSAVSVPSGSRAVQGSALDDAGSARLAFGKGLTVALAAVFTLRAAFMLTLVTQNASGEGSWVAGLPWFQVFFFPAFAVLLMVALRASVAVRAMIVAAATAGALILEVIELWDSRSGLDGFDNVLLQLEFALFSPLAAIVVIGLAATIALLSGMRR